MRNLLALDIWRQTGVVTCPTHRHIDHTTSDIGSNRPHLRMATRPVWSLGRGSAVPCARTWWFDRATQVLPVCVWSRDCRRPADLRLYPTCIKREDHFPATRTALISVSVTLSQIPAYLLGETDTGLVHNHTVCLLMPQLSPVYAYWWHRQTGVNTTKLDMHRENEKINKHTK